MAPVYLENLRWVKRPLIQRYCSYKIFIKFTERCIFFKKEQVFGFNVMSRFQHTCLYFSKMKFPHFTESQFYMIKELTMNVIIFKLSKLAICKAVARRLRSFASRDFKQFDPSTRNDTNFKLKLTVFYVSGVMRVHDKKPHKKLLSKTKQSSLRAHFD